MAEHVFTEGEKKCLEQYWKECSKTPRKNLIKLVSHINMFNPFPSEKSWEYIFFDRQLTDEQVDFALKMKLITVCPIARNTIPPAEKVPPIMH